MNSTLDRNSEDSEDPKDIDLEITSLEKAPPRRQMRPPPAASTRECAGLTSVATGLLVVVVTAFVGLSLMSLPVVIAGAVGGFGLMGIGNLLLNTGSSARVRPA